MFCDHVMIITERLKIPMIKPNTIRTTAWGHKEHRIVKVMTENRITNKTKSLKSARASWFQLFLFSRFNYYKCRSKTLYPNRVKRSERHVADPEVEDSRENEQQATGCSGSWK